MHDRLRRLAAAVILLVLPASCATAEDRQQPFESWLQDFRSYATSKGITEATLDRTLTGVTPNPQVVTSDRNQGEFILSFWEYYDRTVSDQRVATGQALMQKHAALLQQVERRYGVQPRFLVAFWGLETNFGSTFGGHSVIRALVTLAYDPRRSDRFRDELVDALRIVQNGDIAPERMQGSWAGAMGHLQFMPSTFVHYAVDHDGDSRRDIWGSLPDVFGSAANYLSQLGWRGDEAWGREVRLPEGFDYTLASLDQKRSLGEWEALGVRQMDGSPLPEVAGMNGSLVLPAGHLGPAFLVYENFRKIMIWNRSILYALAIGQLSDRIAGMGPLQTPQHPALEARISGGEVEAMQRQLNARGYDAGPVDGRIGPMTRDALRAFQKAHGLPADAYPTRETLQLLQQP